MYIFGHFQSICTCVCSLATCSMYVESSVLPLTSIIAMFVGHSLGVVPVCQLIAAEVQCVS